MSDTKPFLSADMRAALMPDCDSKHRLKGKPSAEWIVWLECPHCGTVAHLLCDDHRKRLEAKPGASWVHPPCGTPETVYLYPERI